MSDVVKGSGNKEQKKREKQEKQNIPYQIHPAGGVYGDLLIEPLGHSHYVYVLSNGVKGECEVKTEEIDKQKKYFLIIDGEKVCFIDNNPITGKLLYDVPNKYKIANYLDGRERISPTKKLFYETLDYLRTLYDVDDNNSYVVITLGVFTSWIARSLSSIFYQGFDAKPGSGKTSFLEGLLLLCRHGYVTGDVTVAFVARITDRFQLSLGIDEVDECPDLYPILRKGYRRGNPYSRLHPKTYQPEVYDVYGFKAFSYVSSLERALTGRTHSTVLAPSNDQRLPILNAYKEQLGKPLSDKFFLWWLENGLDLVSLVSDVALVPSDFVQNHEETIGERREKLYNNILDDLGFTVEDEKAMSRLFGRNQELAFTCLTVSKALGIDIRDSIQQRFEAKQADEADHSDNYYMELLKELLLRHYDVIRQFNPLNEQNAAEEQYFKSSKGKFKDWWYTPMMRIYEEFRDVCSLKRLNTIGTPKFNEYLKELGWVKDKNLVKMRCPEITKVSIIFDPNIYSKLKGDGSE